MNVTHYKEFKSKSNYTDRRITRHAEQWSSASRERRDMRSGINLPTTLTQAAVCQVDWFTQFTSLYILPASSHRELIVRCLLSAKQKKQTNKRLYKQHSVVAMDTCRHGQGGTCPPPGNVEKCFYAANVVWNLSRQSIYASFWEMSSASGASSPDSHRGAVPGPSWGTSVLQTPLLPTRGKNPAGAHGSCRHDAT